METLTYSQWCTLGVLIKATATHYSQLSSTLLNRQLRNLIVTLIIRHIQSILLRNLLAQKPSTDKMPFPLKELGARLWSR